MRLYHITTAKARDDIKFFSEGHPALRDWGNLNPQSNNPRIVREDWWTFFNNPKTKWYCTDKRIHVMKDLDKWRESQELGRLLYYINGKDGDLLWGGGDGLALASFSTRPADNIWVCEADWLRKYHEGELDTLPAHRGFAESRVPLREYRGQFKLAEYMVGNTIESKRLVWSSLPRRFKPVEFHTRCGGEVVGQGLHF